MSTITQESLPHHICNTIHQQSVDYFLQIGKGKYKNILVIGESPALNGWVLSGKAFYTKEGKLVPSGIRFNALFAKFGFSIEEVSFTELCKCILGARRDLLVSCAPKCWNHLVAQIHYCKPTLIIILGKHTSHILETMIEQKIPIGILSEYVIGGQGYNILPIYHPSPINPKSRIWNEKIILDNETMISDIVSTLGAMG